MVASFTGRQWLLGKSDMSLSLADRVLASRGLDDTFKSPKMKDLFPDPWSFQNMKVLCLVLFEAVCKGGRVGVFGDYDVDGACASAIMSEALEACGLSIDTHIPDRIAEGYGPNAEALKAMAERGCGVIVCVDCGSLSGDVFGEVLEAYPDLQILVLDHHVSHVPARNCIAVNPNAPGCQSGIGSVCAGFLALVAVIGLRRVFSEAGREFPVRPESFLDLAGLSTLCDVMPLVGVNRAVVRSGIKHIKKGTRVGIAALTAVSGVERDKVSSFSLGFGLGPRINAGGRIGEAGAGLRLLRSRDREEARLLAEQLDGVNVRRKDIGHDILDAAMAQAEKQVAAGAGVIVVADPEWHVGIVGIVAGRLRESFNRPCLVAGGVSDHAGGEIFKGSARSVKGFDLGGAIIRARSEGLLLSGGGHAMAAGFSFDPDKIDDVCAYFLKNWPELSERPLAEDLEVDCRACLQDLDVDAVRSLIDLEPFGNGFPSPAVLLSRVRVRDIYFVGKAKNVAIIQCLVDGMSLKCIWFKGPDSPLVKGFQENEGSFFDIVGELDVNVWKENESVEMRIIDARVSVSQV